MLRQLLRQTQHFTATRVARGVRIESRADGVTPRARTIRESTWNELERMSDSAFDGTCVLDLGIGVFER